MSKPRSEARRKSDGGEDLPAELVRELAKAPAASWWRHDRCVRWRDNPRRNRNAVEPVAASICEYGFGAPFVAWRPPGWKATNLELIAGDTRHQALALIWSKKPGDKIQDVEVPKLIAGLPRAGFVPVRIMEGITEDQARRLARADNRLGELAGWDPVKLALQLQADLASAGERGHEVLRTQGYSVAYLKKLQEQQLPPPEFPSFGSTTITVKHKCPKCAFEF